MENVMSITNWQTSSMSDWKMDIILDQVMGDSGVGLESSTTALAGLVEGSMGGGSLQAGVRQGKSVSLGFQGLTFRGGHRYNGDDWSLGC